MVNIKQLNTFGIDCHAQHLRTIQQREDLTTQDIHPDHYFVLGGGSNVLFVDETTPDILLIDNQKLTYQDHNDHVLVTAQAGIVWHDLVIDTLNHGYSGLENLALIPGKVGAAPIQNIGAYGVELCDRFVSLTAYHLASKSFVEFSNSDCQFGYRDSFFKSDDGREYCIWDVTLKLDKSFTPVLSYRGLTDLADSADLSAQAVFDTVCHLRLSKLPDPAVTGNAGSFFKNPVVEATQYEQLKRAFPELVAYPSGEQWKLAAGWLIDQAGLKGYRDGDAGIHDKQALVLVNHGYASGRQLVDMAKYARASVLEKFAVKLEPEVNLIGRKGRVNLDDI